MVVVKESTLEKNPQEGEHVVYKYRFMVAFIFILASNMNLVMWSEFGPLQTTLATIYNESLTYISFGTILISNVSYIPANFIGNYILDTYGLRVGIIIGSVLGLIGLWIRCLSSYGFIWIFIGQCFAGVAQPYFYSTPQKISNVWFGSSERTYATTFMAVAMTIGNALGPLIPQIFIPDVNAKSSIVINQVQNMMFWLAVVGTGVCAFTILFMRAEPPTHPSKAAAAKKHDYMNSLKILLRDRNTMMVITTTAVVYGTVINFNSTFQQMIAPFGIGSDQAGNIMAISTAVGLTGALGGAIFIHRFKKFKLFLIGTSFLSLLLLIVGLFTARTGNAFLFGTVATVFSIISTPILPVSLEFGVELAFPVAEATIGGLWFVVNQFSATIESIIVDQLLTSNSSEYDGNWVFIFIILYQAVTMIPLFFMKEDLKRVDYETSNGLLDRESPVKSTQVGTMIEKEFEAI